MTTTSKNKKLGLVISDGVGFRNFILSDFIEEAKKSFDQVIIYSFIPAKAYTPYVKDIEVYELETIREKFYTWFYRKGKEMAHLKKHASNNFGMRVNYKANIDYKNNVRGITTRSWNFFLFFFHTEFIIQILERLQYWTYPFYGAYKKYYTLIRESNPDILFFTHQRPPFIAPFIAASKKCHIKTSVFIFSWDNLASKGRMAGTFDDYTVWSELMKEELLHFYPKLNPKQVYVAGTPQFEPYVLERYHQSREAFLKQLQLDPALRTINFSCGDISTSKNDSLYITCIAKAIEEGRFGEKLNFIVRTSPAESPDRFNDLIKAYPWICWNYPEWDLLREHHPEPWSQRVPAASDMKTLRSLLVYCDLNINMCSTMSLDFMHFDKPVINPVFGNVENGLFNDQMFLNFAHYKRVAESGAVVIAKNEKELLDAIAEELQHPQMRSQARSKLIELQTGGNLQGTSKRLAQHLSLAAFN